MSSTRYAAPGDENNRPEAFLASAKLRGINIGLNVICRVAMARTDEQGRAMIWLHNYAALHRLTADQLSEQLDMTKPDIRAALCDPNFEAMPRFVLAVQRLRSAFEAKLRPLVNTAIRREVHEAIDCAREEQLPVEIISLTRMGKTVAAKEKFLRHMDESVWVTVPSDETETSFIIECCRALGISITNGKKTVQMKQQIKTTVATGKLRLLFFDEGHFLFPADPACQTKPRRLEFVRELSDFMGGSLGIAIIATPQYSLSLNKLMEDCERWAPGQWDGRVIRFHCPDTMSNKDLSAIALWHEPNLAPDAVEQLVAGAQAVTGFAGKMVNVITLARRRTSPGKVITRETILQAQLQMERGGKFDPKRKGAR